MNPKTAASGEAEIKQPLTWNEIMRLAEAGNFQKALNSIDQLIGEKDELKKAYYKGFYLYKLERFDEAAGHIKKLLNAKGHEHYNDAVYYYALSLLNTGKNREGKAILNRIGMKSFLIRNMQRKYSG